MPFQVKILNTVRDRIWHAKDITEKFLLYGYYAENEKVLLIADIEPTKMELIKPTELSLDKGNLKLIGWGYLKDPRIAYISFDNFKIQTSIQDMTPYAIMLVVDAISRKDMRVLHIHGLKLEKIAYTFVNSFDKIYDPFVIQQHNLAKYTDSDQKPHPATKKEAVIDMLNDLRDKLLYIETHGKGADEYPDFQKAIEMSEQALYGRATYYLKRAQKPIEEDVTLFRYKDKYESLLQTMKNDLAAIPSYSPNEGNNELFNTIELLIEQGDALFSSKKYKEAFSKLASAHTTLKRATEGESHRAYEQEKEDEFSEDDLIMEPILSLEETLSDFVSSEQPTADAYDIDEDTDIKDKIITFEEILKGNPDNEWVNGELGDCYFEKGDLDSAREAYRRQERKTPHDSLLLNNIGMIYKFQFNNKRAKEYFTKAIDANEKNAEAYYNLGFIRFEEGDLEDAILNYQKAIKINPEFNLARDSLKVALNKREKYAKQQFYWKKDENK